MFNSDTWIFRNDVWFAKLPEGNGSIQGGERPVVVISNNACNKHSPVITVVPMTTKNNKKKGLPTHVPMVSSVGVENTIACEQIMTIEKKLLQYKISKLDSETIEKVDRALRIQMGMEK